MLTPLEAQEIIDAHDAYWDQLRPRMRELRALYMTDFWRDRQMVHDVVLRTEVPKAYAVVESYLGSLFAKNPAVMVQDDLRKRGNPEVAEATANQYLLTIREQLEDATRLSLIYPCSFLKLAPVENVDPLKRVACSSGRLTLLRASSSCLRGSRCRSVPSMRKLTLRLRHLTQRSCTKPQASPSRLHRAGLWCPSSLCT
jgi:hypothetical protein